MHYHPYLIYSEVMDIKQSQNKITFIINDPNQPKDIEKLLHTIILSKLTAPKTNMNT